MASTDLSTGMSLQNARGLAVNVVRACLSAADPSQALRAALRWTGSLSFQYADAPEAMVQLTPGCKCVLLGVGKAAAPMTVAALEHFSARSDVCRISGLVVTKYDHASPEARTALHAAGIEVLEAGHPVPDEAGAAAARRVLEAAASAGPDDIVVLLLSGGGSALLPLPADGLTLTDLQQLNRALLAAGATINEMNALRKHCSGISGGRLAAACRARTLLTLALSDVVGDRLDVIASGPTVPDPSTFADCAAILAKYPSIAPALPPAVLAHLAAGAAGGPGAPLETPKLHDAAFAEDTACDSSDDAGAAGHSSGEAAAAGAAGPEGRHARTQHQHQHQHQHRQHRRRIAHIVGSNALALRAAADALAGAGVRCLTLTSCLQGEAAEAAKMLLAVAQDSSAWAWDGRPLAHAHGAASASAAATHSGLVDSSRCPQPRFAVLAGGETTVTLTGEPGRGGRNQELALAALVAAAASDPACAALAAASASSASAASTAAASALHAAAASTAAASASPASAASASPAAPPHPAGTEPEPASGSTREPVAAGRVLGPAAANDAPFGRGDVGVLCLGTDGSDGPTDAAGAFIPSVRALHRAITAAARPHAHAHAHGAAASGGSSDTAAAAEAGLQLPSPAAALARHDAYTFFDAASSAVAALYGQPEAAGAAAESDGTAAGAAGAGSAGLQRVDIAPGGLIRTGATGTNVCDITIFLVY